MNLIDVFLEQYIRKIDFYENASKICAQICESELEKEGIRAIVTYRAKRADRLKEKLIKRNKVKHYKNLQHIYDDIKDLAGVRIAIYFPNDIHKIDRFIKDKFDVKEIKRFPEQSNVNYHIDDEKDGEYKKVFSGYNATHYRIHLKHQADNPENDKYTKAVIEIQVASVLMHAWAEVEHDLVYKPMNGHISVDEHEILDELNGLVLAGELALRRLQKAMQDRIKKSGTAFSNHYELAAFIYDGICASTNIRSEDITMGRVDLLFKFLKAAQFNRSEYINKYIDDIDPECKDTSVVEQIIDMIIEEDSSLYRVFLDIKKQMSNKNPYSNSYEDNNGEQSKKSMLYFIDKLADLQFIINHFIDKFYPDMAGNFQTNLNNIINVVNDDDIAQKLKDIRKINMHIIHGNFVPSDQELIDGGNKIESVIEKLITRFDPSEQINLRKKIDEVNINIG
ncbi:GTP pyrophosphokinase [Xylanivirga thermophila]|jgi:ppGpp synthetase/RelA/SpoT-type nucleotidyltranferase|uniref:GTP pyrophosphokinase n=1 Tax=Xylanivirga thermophila TaxID=2496273 RepID=UPI00101BEE93|nr:RelA/SpoT domain-containing protein [Xylanivirga thermophila]